ncbi:MAG: hypothetical protein WC821_01035 [archaeon]
MKKFFKKSFSHERGFNMFSAIVATILIMTGVVLTSTLITTEEKTSRQIYSMLNNYQLADAANIARADALQTFNYNFREQLEGFLSYSDSKLKEEQGFNLFVLRQPGKEFVFDDVKKTFEESILYMDANTGQGFDKAIRFVADNTISQFNEDTYGRFSIYLSGYKNRVDAQNALYTVVKSAVSEANLADESFLDVVGCTKDDCPLGTFYFNIPLNKLSDEAYESLPRIVVKDLVTNEEIKMAILPRTNLKIYIPLRFFKALNEARKAANGLVEAHDDLDSYELGFCNGCQPNSDFAGGLSSWAKPCDGTLKVTIAEILGVTEYTAGDSRAGDEGLFAKGSEVVCQALLDADAFDLTSGDFKILNTTLPPEDPQRKRAINNCGIYRLRISTGQEAKFIVQTGSGAVSAGALLKCGKITGVSADLAYKEDNLAYIVKGTYDGGKSNVYQIRVSDEAMTRTQNVTGPSLLSSGRICTSTGVGSSGTCT